MSEPVIDVEPQQTVYLRFDRKVSIGYDNTRQFSISHPVVLTGSNGDDAVEIDRVTSLIQQVVLDAVGVDYEVINGRIVEKNTELRPPAEPKQSQPSSPSASSGASVDASGFDVSKWGDPDEKRVCELDPSHGEAFNNRRDKAAGKTSFKAPDFKCRQYRKPPKGTECPWVVWHNETV